MEDQPSAPVTRLAVNRSQTELLLDAFGGEADTFPRGWRDSDAEDSPEYIFRRGQILTRDEDVPRVLDALEGQAARVREPNGVAGLARLEVDDTPTALERLDVALGRGVATPDHVVSVAPGGRCPATEPEFAAPDALPWPPATADGCDGAGTLVAVVDTGLLRSSVALHSWLDGVDGEDEHELGADGLIPPYTGHGTFIAGVVRGAAPRADVWVARTFVHNGGVFESDLVDRLTDVLALAPDVISLSAGTYSRLDEDLLGLRVFVERQLPQVKGCVLVAAAGNDATRRPFRPAAMTGTVSVGALSAHGDARASYSNYGGWVDVYAAGTELVNAYANGTYRYREPHNAGRPDVTFGGMASWSGTSFSTPLVAGLIAARMSATGENGQVAAQTLLALARTQAVPGLGAVLRPGDADRSLL